MTSEEYAKVLARHRQVVDIDGVPWEVSARRLLPLRMPHIMEPVDRAKAAAALKQTGAMVAMWNDTWDTPPCDWWWICCDAADYDVAMLPKRGRRDVRAGLRRCKVRRVDVEEMCHAGHRVYAASVNHHGGPAKPKTLSEFTAGAREGAEYAGREYWGAFVDDDLAAYASCIVLDDAVLLSGAKSHPEHHKALPNNALIHTLTQHYLRERGLLYVTDGTRAVRHQTRFQDFLARMGYRRIYCPVRILLHPKAAWVLRSRVHTWGRYVGLHKLAPGILAKSEALASLVEIARKCESLQAPSTQSAGSDTGSPIPPETTD